MKFLHLVLAGVLLGEMSGVPAVRAQENAAVQQDWNRLSPFEQKTAQRVQNPLVVGRPNIVLIYPPDVQVDFPPETGIHDMGGLADWLEDTYQRLKRFTGYDPNQHWFHSGQPRNRLCIVMDGSANFQFGGDKPRPVIGGKDSVTAPIWFQYISHEMGHDFMHGHPKFNDRIAGWGEGMAEYLAYSVLREKMPQAAARFEAKMIQKFPRDPDNRYSGRAYQLILMQRKMGFRDATDFLAAMAGHDINIFMGKREETQAQDVADISGSLVAAWDFKGDAPLKDKATGGRSKDTLMLVGGASVKDGVAVVPGTGHSALEAVSSPDVSLRGEMTLWMRFRLRGKGNRIVSLIDKRHFKDPEARTYGMMLFPAPLDPGKWILGGQISDEGTRDTAQTLGTGEPSVSQESWQEVAMVVRGQGDYAVISWYVSSGNEGEEAQYQLAAGPVSRAMHGVFQSQFPLFLGNDCTLGDNGVNLEIDEARIYDKPLSDNDLERIQPGQFP